MLSAEVTLAIDLGDVNDHEDKFSQSRYHACWENIAGDHVFECLWWEWIGYEILKEFNFIFNKILFSKF